jgi:hypothetical protein
VNHDILAEDAQHQNWSKTPVKAKISTSQLKYFIYRLA